MPSVKFEHVVAWGEMDAFGHVNNTQYLRWFESARIHAFEQLGVITTGFEQGAAPILARATVDFRAPVVYPDTVEVESWVEKIGTTSFTMKYRALSRKLQKVCAEGEGVVVMVMHGAKVEIDPALRSKLSALTR